MRSAMVCFFFLKVLLIEFTPTIYISFNSRADLTVTIEANIKIKIMLTNVF